MYKHLLLATDGSELSQRGIREGLALATKLGAQVTGFFATQVYAYAFDYGYIPASGLAPAEFEAAENRRAEKALSSVLAGARELGLTADVCAESHTSPAQAIIDAATSRGCDLIVIASHGRGGFTGMLLGSVTLKVLSHSKIPVLVIR